MQRRRWSSSERRWHCRGSGRLAQLSRPRPATTDANCENCRPRRNTVCAGSGGGGFLPPAPSLLPTDTSVRRARRAGGARHACRAWRAPCSRRCTHLETSQHSRIEVHFSKQIGTFRSFVHASVNCTFHSSVSQLICPSVHLSTRPSARQPSRHSSRPPHVVCTVLRWISASSGPGPVSAGSGRAARSAGRADGDSISQPPLHADAMGRR